MLQGFYLALNLYMYLLSLIWNIFVLNSINIVAYNITPYKNKTSTIIINNKTTECGLEFLCSSLCPDGISNLAWTVKILCFKVKLK